MRELAVVQKQQDAVTVDLEHRRHDRAAGTQLEIRERERALSARVAGALAKIERSAPSMAAEATSVHESAHGRQLAPAADSAREKIAAAARAQDAVTGIDRKKEPATHGIAQAEADRQTRAAAEETRKTSALFVSRISELKDLSARIDAALKAPAHDEIERHVVDAALQDIEQAVREKVEKEVTETAIPTASDRIVVALDPELKKRNLDDAKFRQFLEKDIRSALADEMNRHKPDPETAMLKTKQEFALRDKASLDATREELTQVARRLNELAARQEALRDKVPEDTPSRDAMQQHHVAEQVRTVHEQTGRALATARKATLLHDAQIHAAAQQVNDPAVANRVPVTD